MNQVHTNFRNEMDTILEAPIPIQNRQITDKKGFILFAILMLILIPLVSYTLLKSDIRKLNTGSDNCGNLCGYVNEINDGISCSGKDHSNKPYEIYNIVTGERMCSEECSLAQLSEEEECYDENTKEFYESIWTAFLEFWWKLLIAEIITIILCISTLFLYRYHPGFVIWSILIISLLSVVGVTITFWVLYTQTTNESNKQSFSYVAIVGSLFTFIALLMFCISICKISLIIKLYKESAKALFAMPLMMFIPILTLIVQVFIIILAVFTTVYMSTAKELVKDGNKDKYEYKAKTVMIFAIMINIFITIWAIHFFTSYQYMTLSGSVVQWFFKKNSEPSPILLSFKITTQFHLGTVAFGSFILTVIFVIKALITLITRRSRANHCIQCCFCCCDNIATFLKYLSRTSYIETAIYGQSFIMSSKKAIQTLIKNFGDSLSVNSLGSYVLMMTQFLLIIVSTSISYCVFMDDKYVWSAILISFVANILIVIVVFNVLETVIDSLFICFCEDLEISNGTTKPYRMSKDLMQLVQSTKKYYVK